MKKGINQLLQNHWDALLASVVACIALYYLTGYGGIGLSPDSIEYSTTAINIKEKAALVNFNGSPLVAFPAGYPIFLAAGYIITGIRPVPLAPFLNGFLYVGVILMSSFIMQSFSGITRWYRMAILTILACSPCLWEVYGMIWSETLFLFLILLFMLAWRWYGERKTIFSLFIFALVGACAFVTRFAGITVIATGAALIFFDGSLPVLKKIKRLFVFLLTGISFVLVNLVRNRQVSGTASGVREKALRSLGDNLLSIGDVLSGWLPFINEHRTAGAVVFILLALWAMVFIGHRILQQQFYLRNETIVFVFFFVYAVFIVAVSSISRFEELSSRLLSPIYIPLLWIGSSWLPAFIKAKTRFPKRTLQIFSTLLFVLFVYHQYKQNAANWEGIAYAGIPGYSENQWTKSPTIQYINTHKDQFNTAIYSDAHDGLYYLTGVISQPLPHKEIEKEKKEFLDRPSSIVIWFNDAVNKDLIDIDFIKTYKQLTATKTFDDGAIYFFRDSAVVSPQMK